MEFMLWAVRSLHLFSVVVWLGGTMYQAVVIFPVAKDAHGFGKDTLQLLQRFLPFVWMCVWTILITGVALMLFNPRFVFFNYSDRWSIFLGLKQLAFLLMIFFSFGYARMFASLYKLLIDEGRKQAPEQAVWLYYQRMLQFSRINVVLGLITILLASALK